MTYGKQIPAYGPPRKAPPAKPAKKTEKGKSPRPKKAK